jgi:hypothetical protein
VGSPEVSAINCFLEKDSSDAKNLSENPNFERRDAVASHLSKFGFSVFG